MAQKNKIISIFLVLTIIFTNIITFNTSFANDLNLNLIDTKAENNLFCSNVLNNKVSENIKYTTRTKIIKIIKNIGNKNKYTDHKIFLVNKKILKLAEKSKIKNNKKKQALYYFVMTELDKILKNKNVLDSNYKNQECLLAFKLGSDVNLIAKNRGYFLGSKNIDRFNEDKNVNELNRSEKDENVIIGNVNEVNDRNNKSISKKEINKIDFKKIAEEQKNNVSKQNSEDRNVVLNKKFRDLNTIPEIENKKIMDAFFKENKIYSKTLNNFLKNTLYNYNNGKVYIRNGFMFNNLGKTNIFLNSIKTQSFISNDIKIYNLEKNIKYKILKNNIIKTNKFKDKLYPNESGKTRLITKDEKLFIYNLYSKTNLYQKYQTRPLLTSNFIKIKNNIKYIKNKKGKLVPLDYNLENENLEKYNISNYEVDVTVLGLRDGKQTFILNGYYFWEKYFNEGTIKERILYLKTGNDFRFNFLENKYNNIVFGPNDIEYKAGLTKKEYEELDNYIKEEEKIKNEINELNVKIKKANINSIKSKDPTSIYLNYVNNSESNFINKYKNQKEKYLKKIEIIQNKKADIYLKWFDRKNICYGPHFLFFDKDNYKRIYNTLTNEYIKYSTDRLNTFKITKRLKQVSCLNYYK